MVSPWCYVVEESSPDFLYKSVCICVTHLDCREPELGLDMSL